MEEAWNSFNIKQKKPPDFNQYLEVKAIPRPLLWNTGIERAAQHLVRDRLGREGAKWERPLQTLSTQHLLETQ